MERRAILGGLALAAVPVGAFAGRAAPAGIEVLTTHLANPERSGQMPRPGQHLILRREHGRSFDPAAVAVETSDGGRHLGYLPPVQAGVLSRLLDHGARASAKVTDAGLLQVFLHLA